MPTTDVNKAIQMAIQRGVLTGNIDPQVARIMGYEVPDFPAVGPDPIKTQQLMLQAQQHQQSTAQANEADMADALREQQDMRLREMEHAAGLEEKQRDREAKILIEREKLKSAEKMGLMNAFARPEQSNAGAPASAEG